MDLEDIRFNLGSVNPSGVSDEVYYIPKKFISTFPTINDDFDSAAPTLMHYATNEDQKTFPDYQSEEFRKAYPISQTAYPTPRYSYGDINGDRIIDAIDSSFILSEYARLSSGGVSSFSQTQTSYADIDHNGIVDSVDASLVLLYYAKVSNGADITLSDLIKK